MQVESRATPMLTEDKASFLPGRLCAPGRVVLSATRAFATFSFHYTDIAAKNDEKLGTHILIQGVYMLYRKLAYPWVEL